MSTADQTRTKSAYGLQWNRFRLVRPEEDRVTFRNRTHWACQDLEGKTILDAGCGMGRYLRIVGESPARLVVGVNLSRAVDAARELTRHLPHVAVLQSDLLRLPFPAGSFDLIYSLGVVDHTPNPRAAFLALARLLKPGGRMAIWVYPREHRVVEWMMNLQRAVSTRLPLGLLEPLCRISAPIGSLKQWMMSSRGRLVQRLGVAVHLATIGVSMHPDPEVRVCDTLDWYAPRYLTRHTFEEVAGWFAEAGLTGVVDLSRDQVFYHKGQGHGINLAGCRPSEPPSEGDRTLEPGAVAALSHAPPPGFPG